MTLHNALGLVFATPEPLCLLPADLIFLHSSSPRLACLCSIPEPHFTWVFCCSVRRVCLTRPRSQAPELFSALEQGFRNANKEFIQPHACLWLENLKPRSGARFPKPSTYGGWRYPSSNSLSLLGAYGGTGT